MRSRVSWTKFSIVIFGLHVANILAFAMLIWRLVQNHTITFDPPILAVDRARSLALLSLNTHPSRYTDICFVTAVDDFLSMTKMFCIFAV